MQLRNDLDAKAAASWALFTATMWPSATSGAQAIPAEDYRAEAKRQPDEWDSEQYNPRKKGKGTADVYPQQWRGQYRRGINGGREYTSSRRGQMTKQEWYKGFNQIKGRGKGAKADYYFLYGSPPDEGDEGAPADHDHWSWNTRWNSWTSWNQW